MQSSASDFDFLFGLWNVKHRRLRRRLEQCDEWIEFNGTCSAHSILGGSANIDDNLLELPESTYRAASLRTFDNHARQWSIWWLDGRFPDQLTTPVIGGFLDGVGEFYADDTLADKAIRVRFRWTMVDSQTPQWEQAFSADEGKSWETNWVMVFTRPTS